MDNPTSTEQIYEDYKPLLFALAYRMLGSVMDAEDVVQEAFIALNKAGIDTVQHLKAYLCKIVTNRCIDRLRSSSKKREVYVGPWLPEPLVTEDYSDSDPAQSYAMKESISTAYLLLLQQLSAVERAVFLLREVLQYEYDEISEIVGKSNANCRQIFRRAKHSIGRPEEQAADTKPNVFQPINGLVEQFVQALSSGDINNLMKLLSTDAALYSDGGGKVTSAVRPILGADRIISFLMGLLKKIPSNFKTKFSYINGQLGILSYGDGYLTNVISFHVINHQIQDIYMVTNPDKLTHLNKPIKI
jgi:RNA polymerase sigma-70 factor (TIGR02957 family)